MNSKILLKSMVFATCLMPMALPVAAQSLLNDNNKLSTNASHTISGEELQHTAATTLKEALYAAAKPPKSIFIMAFQQSSAACAKALTLGSVMSLPSTTEHPGRRGSMGIMMRWLSSQFRIVSSWQVSIFSGQ